MRENRPSGSEGGEAGTLTGLPYPYQRGGCVAFSLGFGHTIGSR